MRTIGSWRCLAVSLGVCALLVMPVACTGPVTPPVPGEQALLVKQGLDIISNGSWEYSYPYGVVIDGEGGECSEEAVFSIFNLQRWSG